MERGKIVDISRAFLNLNGVEKHIDVELATPCSYEKEISKIFTENYLALVGDLNVCSKKGLSEQFDSTIDVGPLSSCRLAERTRLLRFRR